jgi:hypothetical protein
MTKPTTEPTETAAETVGNILTFKMCDCGAPFPHGYFYLPNDNQSPNVSSLKSGRLLLDEAENMGVISSEEKSLHLATLATSGITEDGPSDEAIEEYLRERDANDPDRRLKMIMSRLGIPEELASRVKIIRL